jgi:hypothetical protein
VADSFPASHSRRASRCADSHVNGRAIQRGISRNTHTETASMAVSAFIFRAPPHQRWKNHGPFLPACKNSSHGRAGRVGRSSRLRASVGTFSEAGRRCCRRSFPTGPARGHLPANPSNKAVEATGGRCVAKFPCGYRPRRPLINTCHRVSVTPMTADQVRITMSMVVMGWGSLGDWQSWPAGSPSRFPPDRRRWRRPPAD